MSKVICLLKSVTVAVGNANDEAEDDDGDVGDEGLIDIGPKDLKSEIRTLRVGIWSEG